LTWTCPNCGRTYPDGTLACPTDDPIDAAEGCEVCWISPVGSSRFVRPDSIDTIEEVKDNTDPQLQTDGGTDRSEDGAGSGRDGNSSKNDRSQETDQCTESTSSRTANTQSGAQSSTTSSSTMRRSANFGSGGSPDDRTVAGRVETSERASNGLKKGESRERTTVRTPSKKRSGVSTGRRLLCDGGQEGLYRKYDVRKDGETVEDCFVLEPDEDRAARAALRAYADVTDNDDLAADIREQFELGQERRSLEVVQAKAAEGICHLCDEPVTVHHSRNLTTMSFVPAIRDAVEHANRHPSNNERDGDIEYVAEDGYYPGDKSHFIDLSGVAPDYRRSASIQVVSQLAERNLAVNSVQWEPPRLHVMAVDSMAYGYYGGVANDD